MVGKEAIIKARIASVGKPDKTNKPSCGLQNSFSKNRNIRIVTYRKLLNTANQFPDGLKTVKMMRNSGVSINNTKSHDVLFNRNLELRQFKGSPRSNKLKHAKKGSTARPGLSRGRHLCSQGIFCSVFKTVNRFHGATLENIASKVQA